tara:strand:- start:68 stop:772 length:705 start_codon:yes stop_codon:yes gene_type:complete
MNQFIQSWKFSLKNWKFFLILGLPVISIEIVLGYLVLPLEEIYQVEDIANYIDANIGIFFLVIVVGLIVQMSFLGGVWIAYMSIDTGKKVTPMNALQIGLTKFFPLLGACFTIGIPLILIFILLPASPFPIPLAVAIFALYLLTRIGLFAANIMLDNNKIFESINSSWRKTDEHGFKLFIFVLIFMSLSVISAYIIISVIPGEITQLILLSIVEYIFMIPLYYIFYTLHKAHKS